MSSDATTVEGIGEYKFGFSDPDTTVFKSKKGLDREIVEQISEMKGEPDWMLRVQAESPGSLYSSVRCPLGVGICLNSTLTRSNSM